MRVLAQLAGNGNAGEVIAALSVGLTDGNPFPFVRIYIIHTLAQFVKFGNVAAIAAVSGCLEDEDPRVRLAADKALSFRKQKLNQALESITAVSARVEEGTEGPSVRAEFHPSVHPRFVPRPYPGPLQ